MSLPGSPRPLLAALVCLVGLGAAPSPGVEASPAQPAQAAPAAAPDLEIPFTTFTLDNGLKVILHEDHTVPLVAVNLSYEVGSKDEQAGRTGFAHLFEHLMFMGTERAPRGRFDAWMEAAGGWNNAWTSEDRTDYFDVGPSHILPLLLWLEADRLSSLGPQIDAEKLDLQREVVRNERRQTSENVPYGVVDLRLPDLLYPPGHPYHHTVIGSHEDLQAATVDDVRAFFATWYVPRNASLVVAGDIDPAAVEDLVRRYFGWIPSPPEPPPHAAAQEDPGFVPGSETLTDRVELPRVVMAWRSPAHLTAGDAEMDVLAGVLATGKASRLHRSLVYEQQVAQDVYAGQWSGELDSRFVVWATAREGVTADALAAALSKELGAVRAQGVTEDEVSRARNRIQTDFVSRLQSVAERASLLNAYEAAVGDPGYVSRDLARYTDATPSGISAFARDVLDPARAAVLRVLPAPADEDK